jgi:hypothetical protein
MLQQVSQEMIDARAADARFLAASTTGAIEALDAARARE